VYICKLHTSYITLQALQPLPPRKTAVPPAAVWFGLALSLFSSHHSVTAPQSRAVVLKKACEWLLARPVPAPQRRTPSGGRRSDVKTGGEVGPTDVKYGWQRARGVVELVRRRCVDHQGAVGG
jgi:hypothetical protein